MRYKDLLIGQEGENKVSKILVDAGWTILPTLDKKQRSFYDIEASKGKVRILVEVKNDKYAAISGNIAIEIFNTKSNKPSGINITKSCIWAVILDNEIWFASTIQLKKFIKDAIPHKSVNNGGDKNAALLIYRKDHILPKIFHRVDDIVTDELNKLIEKLC